MSTNELWKDIPGYEGLYEVSSIGRVKSLPKKRKNGVGVVSFKEKILKNSICYKNKWTYPLYRVNLRKDGKTNQFKVHRLVLMAFIGPPKDGEVCRHLDGNALNNSIENICWGTVKENHDDSVKHGTNSNPPIAYGEAHHNSKMSDKDVFELRSKKLYKGFYSQMARKYGVSDVTIKRIYSGESRK